ncbi:MAG: hypothetical protein IPH07_11225 [Deltaproteobacteria bacterium]|nr:hypothetical protein [Deltaproteobacteria bacterium]MBK8719006.1 hypothetical protein [Deltaproteobacteria bacterium]MBP7285440.1 hypothetical protein [Nannocystaceae bacterium]
MEDASESGTHTFSDIDLSVKIRKAAGGFCTLSGALVSTATDSSKDAKSMVAVTSTTLAGQCVEVFLDKVAVPPAGITTRTFCYAAAVVDDAPQ